MVRRDFFGSGIVFRSHSPLRQLPVFEIVIMVA